MLTQLSFSGSLCRDAVVGYVAQLAASGLPVRIQARADVPHGVAGSEGNLELSWLPAATQQQNWEEEHEPVDSQRVVMHYLPTIRLLAADHGAATAFLKSDRADERDREAPRAKRLPR
jgi:hypothetical protein